MSPIRPISPSLHRSATPSLRVIKLGPKGLNQLSRRARRTLLAHPAARRDGHLIHIPWSAYQSIKCASAAKRPPRLKREYFLLPLARLMSLVGFKLPGDTLSRLAKPIARTLGLSCLDPATRQLRPGSPCARVAARMNRE